MNRRLVVSLISGAILGVVCIFGAQLRYSGSVDSIYLFAFWFNRLLMGLTIGFISYQTSLKNRLLRGFIIGIVVSFAFYSATQFYDLTGFLVGGIYGVIIEYVAFRFEK